jgi:rhodanese-related sulfurtransferase
MKQLAPRDLAAHCAATAALLLDVRESWEVERAAIRLPGVPFKHIPLSRIPDHRLHLPSRGAKPAGRRIPRAQRLRVGL